jgi:uncharacterized protein (TIGR02001 family)
MKLSKLSRAVVAASLLATGAAAHAEITTSGSVAFTSDYKYRGITQTDNGPAVQGGLTLSHDSGLYFAVWASSVHAPFVADAPLEIDPSIGYSFTSGDVTYDMGVLYYGYPGAEETAAGVDELNFTEFYGSVAFGGAKVGLAYTPDYTGDFEDHLYTYVSYGTEVAGFGVSASVGYNKLLDSKDSFSAVKDDDNYIDYKVGVTKELAGLTVEVAYIGSDLDKKDLGSNYGEGKAIVTVSKAF